MIIDTQKSTSSVAQVMKLANLNLLATQFNSKESVDLCSFWKVATLEKGGVWGA